MSLIELQVLAMTGLLVGSTLIGLLAHVLLTRIGRLFGMIFEKLTRRYITIMVARVFATLNDWVSFAVGLFCFVMFGITIFVGKFVF